MKNWWYYHKWYIICGLLLCFTCIYLICNAIGWFKKEPDLQIAYVGEASLPDDTVNAIKQAFSAFTEDYNQDGEIIVQVNQYVNGSSEDTSSEAAAYRQASELSLIADISDCESYLFLLDNPDDFQKSIKYLRCRMGNALSLQMFPQKIKQFPGMIFPCCPNQNLALIQPHCSGKKPLAKIRIFYQNYILADVAFMTSGKPITPMNATHFGTH